ncbi:hypothetical protein ACEPAG_7345 [Sanghuangporus baumii]
MPIGTRQVNLVVECIGLWCTLSTDIRWLYKLYSQRRKPEFCMPKSQESKGGFAQVKGSETSTAQWVALIMCRTLGDKRTLVALSAHGRLGSGVLVASESRNSDGHQVQLQLVLVIHIATSRTELTKTGKAMFKGLSKRPVSVGPSSRDQDSAGKENRPRSIAAPKSARRVSVFQDADRNRDSRALDASRASQNKPEKVQTPKPGSDSKEMENAFDKLLDDLQIPESLRPKLSGMDSHVKAAMLRSSQVIKQPVSTIGTTPNKSANTLRKSKSSDSFSSPRSQNQASDDLPPPAQTAGRFLGAAMRSSISLGRHSDDEVGQVRGTARHSRGLSLDVSKHSSRISIPMSLSDGTGKKMMQQQGWSKDTAPSRYANILAGTSSLELDVEIVKKLRLLLRNESATWTETFFQLDGYSALLTRLNELLEVEWREEQHDDQLLHELLRCLKALSTSAVGCAALRSEIPTPYAQLVRLLFSDKKPGDIATRQLIAELLLILFDLYPPTSLPSPSSTTPTRQRRREMWEDFSDICPVTDNPQLISLPSPHRSLFSFIRTLLLTKPPPPAEGSETPLTPHEFIESLHVPRIYKTYLQELSDVCRDYFWVFCHPSNTIWNLNDTDEKRVEKPRAPGGMTGGVEFEAMAYLTTHFKFINAVAKSAADLNLPKENELSAHRFHSDLFASGLERVILVARKASTTYYPTLHLEIGRYAAIALQAQYELPWTLSRIIGPPPAGMAKPGKSTKERDRNRNSASTTRSVRGSPSTPTRNRGAASGVPKIPTPKKIEPLRF